MQGSLVIKNVVAVSFFQSKAVQTVKSVPYSYGQQTKVSLFYFRYKRM